MKAVLNGGELELLLGDITDQTTDAIVNAANAKLAGGSGVDGAIHRRGGPSIMAETDAKYPQGCPTGDAVPSGAGDLSAKVVVHAVGPIWRGGGANEAEQLESAHRRSFEVAAEQGCESVALPALSTGAYAYPLDQAAAIAVGAALTRLAGDELPRRIRFVLFDDEALQAFQTALQSLAPQHGASVS